MNEFTYELEQNGIDNFHATAAPLQKRIYQVFVFIICTWHLPVVHDSKNRFEQMT